MNGFKQGMLIKTHYLGCTNYRGSRVKAVHKRDSERTWQTTCEWDDALDAPKNHHQAAQKLCDQLTENNQYFNFKLRKILGFDKEAYYWITETCD